MIKTRPISENTPLQIGFASNHSTKETVKDPNIARITIPPNAKIHTTIIPATNNFSRDIILNSLF